MRKTLKGFTVLLLVSFLFPLTLKDSLGRKHVLKPPVRRLVSLSPAITDDLVAIGAEKLIVGTTSFSHIKGAKKLGGIINPNIEMILALKPDLVLVMQPTPLKLVWQLESLGLEVFPIREPRNLREIAEVVFLLGKITAREGKAKAVGQEFLDKVKPLPVKKGKIFIGFPSPPFWAACRETFLDDLARRAGWENVCRGKGWKPVSGEEILASSPDLLVIPATSPQGPWIRKFPWRKLESVKKGRVLAFPPDLLLRPTVSLAEVFEKLAEYR